MVHLKVIRPRLKGLIRRLALPQLILFSDLLLMLILLRRILHVPVGVEQRSRIRRRCFVDQLEGVLGGF